MLNQSRSTALNYGALIRFYYLNSIVLVGKNPQNKGDFVFSRLGKMAFGYIFINNY